MASSKKKKKTDREAENYVRYKKFSCCMLKKCARKNSELCRVLCFNSPLMVNGIGKTCNSNAVFIMNRHQGKGDVQLQGFPCHYLSGVFLKLWGVRKRYENILGLQTEIVLAPPPDLYILSLFIGYFFYQPLKCSQETCEYFRSSNWNGSLPPTHPHTQIIIKNYK